MKKNSALTAMFFSCRLFFSCLIVLPVHAQLYNNGSLISITPGGYIKCAGDLQNTAAATVINNGTIELTAAFINDGTFNAGNGNIVFTGSAPANASFIGGSAPISFFDLTINKTANDVQLNQSISVSHHCTLQSGNVQLNSHNVNLGVTGMLMGEKNGSRITGTSGGHVLASAVLNAPNAANPGNLGLMITSSANLGTTAISRGHKQPTGNNGGVGIYRYYDISPANNTALNATVQFNYLDAELGAIAETELVLWNSTDGGTTWAKVGNGADDRNASANYIVKNNIDNLARLAAGSAVTNPLPLQLLSFTGRLKNEAVELKWLTASEVNVSHFELERANTSGTFQRLANIQAAASSNGGHKYSFVDPQPFSNISFYRLKMVDIDGQFTYSGIVKIEKDSRPHLSVYPNPTYGEIFISFYLKEQKDVLIALTDQSGRVVKQQVVRCPEGLINIQWSIEKYASGIYYLQVDGQPVKIIRQ